MTPRDEMPDHVREALDRLRARITLSEIGIGATYEQDGIRFMVVNTRQSMLDVPPAGRVYIDFAWLEEEGAEWKF